MEGVGDVTADALDRLKAALADRYTIERELGSGGMATVYLAEDLQHPNILALHDSGEVDGFLFYVMPYIEGPSLRDKLAREGELPIGDAVRILRDVVER